MSHRQVEESKTSDDIDIQKGYEGDETGTGCEADGAPRGQFRCVNRPRASCFMRPTASSIWWNSWVPR